MAFAPPDPPGQPSWVGEALRKALHSTSPYEVLSLPQGVTAEEAKKAYWNLMKVFSPNRVAQQQGLTDEQRRLYEEAAKNITKAMRNLRNSAGGDGDTSSDGAAAGGAAPESSSDDEDLDMHTPSPTKLAALYGGSSTPPAAVIDELLGAFEKVWLESPEAARGSYAGIQGSLDGLGRSIATDLKHRLLGRAAVVPCGATDCSFASDWAATLRHRASHPRYTEVRNSILAVLNSAESFFPLTSCVSHDTDTLAAVVTLLRGPRHALQAFFDMFKLDKKEVATLVTGALRPKHNGSALLRLFSRPSVCSHGVLSTAVPPCIDCVDAVTNNLLESAAQLGQVEFLVAAYQVATTSPATALQQPAARDPLAQLCGLSADASGSLRCVEQFAACAAAACTSSHYRVSALAIGAMASQADVSTVLQLILVLWNANQMPTTRDRIHLITVAAQAVPLPAIVNFSQRVRDQAVRGGRDGLGDEDAAEVEARNNEMRLAVILLWAAKARDPHMIESELKALAAAAKLLGETLTELLAAAALISLGLEVADSTSAVTLFVQLASSVEQMAPSPSQWVATAELLMKEGLLLDALRVAVVGMEKHFAAYGLVMTNLRQIAVYALTKLGDEEAAIDLMRQAPADAAARAQVDQLVRIRDQRCQPENVAAVLRLLFGSRSVSAFLDQLQWLLTTATERTTDPVTIKGILRGLDDFVGPLVLDPNFKLRPPEDMALVLCAQGVEALLACAVKRFNLGSGGAALQPDSHISQLTTPDGLPRIAIELWMKALRLRPQGDLAEFMAHILGDAAWHCAVVESWLVSAGGFKAMSDILAGVTERDVAFAPADLVQALDDKDREVASTILRKFGSVLRPLRRFEAGVRRQSARTSALRTSQEKSAALVEQARLTLNMTMIDHAPALFCLIRAAALLCDAADALPLTREIEARRIFTLARAAAKLAADTSNASDRCPHALKVQLHASVLVVLRRAALQHARAVNGIPSISGPTRTKPSARGTNNTSVSPFFEVDMTAFATAARRLARAFALVPWLSVDAGLRDLTLPRIGPQLLAQMVYRQITNETQGLLFARALCALASSAPGAGTKQRLYPLTSEVAVARFSAAVQGWLDSDDDEKLAQVAARHAPPNQADKTGEDNEPNNILADYLRRVAMGTMMDDAGLTLEQLRANAAPPFVPREPDGFLPPKPSMPLKIGRARGANGGLASVQALELNLKTGHISIVGNPSPSSALVDDVDVGELLRLQGAPSFVFSLDPTNADESGDLVPFQRMAFAPDELWDTSVLATLSHTDHVLKMLTTGVEISGYSPFAFKPADSLYKCLPFGDELRKLCEEAHNGGGPRRRRFWIENGTVDIDYHVDVETGRLTICVGDAIQMRIKTAALVVDADGQLSDAAVGDDAEDPAFRMAQLLTNKYEGLGKAFPAFARLRELSKLLAAIHVLRTFLDAMEPSSEDAKQKLQRLKQIASPGPLAADDKEELKALRDAIQQYPLANRETISRRLREINSIPTREDVRRELESLNSAILYEPGVQAQITAAVDENMQKIERQFQQAVDRQLIEARTADQQLRKLLIENIVGRQLMVDQQWAREIADAWLSRKTLPSEVVDRVMRERARVMAKTLLTYGLDLGLTSERVGENLLQAVSRPRDQWGSGVGRCLWLPAVVRSQKMMVVYGGVQLSARVQQRGIDPPAQSAYRLAPATLNAQRTIGAPYSAAVQMDNLAAANRAAAASRATGAGAGGGGRGGAGGGGAGGSGGGRDGDPPDYRNPNLIALRQLAAESGDKFRHTGQGITRREAETLIGWAREYKLENWETKARIETGHQGSSISRGLHFHFPGLKSHSIPVVD